MLRTFCYSIIVSTNLLKHPREDWFFNENLYSIYIAEILPIRLYARLTCNTDGIESSTRFFHGGDIQNRLNKND